MNVITHHDICVEVVVSKTLVSISNSFYDHFCNFWLAKVQGTSPSIVEYAIHYQKSFSGSCLRWETPPCGNTTAKAPADKHGSSDIVIVRQAASVELHYIGVGA